MTISRLRDMVGGTVDNLTQEEREDLIRLDTLANIPKVKFSTRVAVTVYPPTARGKKKVYSHIELYKNVEALATALRAAGVRPGTVLAIAMPNSFAGIVYFLATQWIGAVAAPIDPALSEDELVASLGELKPLAIVSPLVDASDRDDDTLYQKVSTAADKLSIIPWFLYQTINEGVLLDTNGQRAADAAAWAGGSADFKLDPEEVCLRLKGNSDVPPLVLPLSSKNITDACKAFRATYELSTGNTTVLATPLCTMQGVLILSSALYSGGHVVLPPAGDFDPALFWDMVTDDSVSWISSTPETIMDLYEKTLDNPPTTSSLSFVRSCAGFGGEECIPADMLAKVEDTLKAPILESYGPPEAAGLATANKEFDFRPGTVGMAVSGCKVALLDTETKEHVAVGERGDIYVSGGNVTVGYLNNDSINQDSQVTIDDEDWFCVGDRGELDSEGYLKVFGNSRAARAVELEERSAAAAVAAAAAAAAAAVAAKEAEERKAKEEAEAEVRRLQEEEDANARRIEEEERAAVFAEEEEARLKLEEEEHAAAMAEEERAAAKAEEDAKRRAEEEGAKAEETSRSISAYEAAKVPSTGLIMGSSQDFEALMSKLGAIESNQKKLEADITDKHNKELAEMEARLALLEEEKKRAVYDAKMDIPDNNAPVLMELNMDEVESAVVAAASSAEEASGSTRAAVDASVSSSKYASDSAAAASTAADAATAAAAAAGEATLIAKDLADKSSMFEAPDFADPDAIKKSLNISLVDIDNSLKTHAAVIDARAFGKPDEKYGTEIFCAVQPRKGARLSEAWLKLHAQSVLPAMMVPKKFFLVERLPAERKELVLCDDIIATYGVPSKSSTRVIKAPQWKPPGGAQ